MELTNSLKLLLLEATKSLKRYAGRFFMISIVKELVQFAIDRPKTTKKARCSYPECGPRHEVPVPLSVPIRFGGACPSELHYPGQPVSDHRGSNSQVIDFESVKIYPIFTVKIKNPGKSNT